MLLTTGDIFEDFSDGPTRDPALAAVLVLDTELITDRCDLPAVVPPAGNSVALLQYTAGTSGVPRGVVVTHANLVHNHRQIALSLDTSDTSVYLSWLPMFHDMGLGIALQAVWRGVTCVLMSPQAFMLEPRRWLAAISRYRATSSGGPDFAFEHCVRRIRPEDCADLDLSCWRVAYNGSEPVSASTIDRFSNAFGSVGFRRDAFHPVYGLAEATLLATSELPHQPPLIRHFSGAELERGEARAVEPRLGRPLVSCGRPWLEAAIAIVDPTTLRETEPRHLGEIWLQSDSVAAGYWDRDAETKATFLATTPSRTGTFLRTGDRGFIDDGRLYVTGREGDSIVVEGRTLNPHEIEATVSACHLALVPQGAAAFLLESEQGRGLVVLQEVTRRALRRFDGPEVVQAIRSAVARGHALEAEAVVLLKPATLPRTTSGKVRRSICRTAFTEESLQAVFRWSRAD
jgi:acyl-CoA synthetase (AMP-forming)/AMP-acid ligase II